MSPESFYDQEVDTRRWEPQGPTSGVVARSTPAAVNPVTGHGLGCECKYCPSGQLAWYEARVATMEGRPAVPAPRKPNPLFDQVVPVCCLLAMLIIGGLVLTPVIVPVITISVVAVVAIVIALVMLAVVALVLLFVFMKVRRDLDVNKNNGKVIKYRP